MYSFLKSEGDERMGKVDTGPALMSVWYNEQLILSRLLLCNEKNKGSELGRPLLRHVVWLGAVRRSSEVS